MRRMLLSEEVLDEMYEKIYDVTTNEEVSQLKIDLQNSDMIFANIEFPDTESKITYYFRFNNAGTAYAPTLTAETGARAFQLFATPFNGFMSYHRGSTYSFLPGCANNKSIPGYEKLEKLILQSTTTIPIGTRVVIYRK